MAVSCMQTVQLPIIVMKMMATTTIMTTKMEMARMLDDFFMRAVLAGLGVALVAGPLGCFIVWRRMAYFGDTLAHAGLLGVAIAFLFQINVTIAVFLISALISIIMLLLQRRGTLSSDSVLGLLSHSALALGLVAIGFMSWLRVDLNAFLFGDILSVSATDIGIIYLGGIFVLATLVGIWRHLFAATVNFELAKAEGMRPEAFNLIFMLLMAIVIAIAIKIVGVLLITAMLIIPAATARRFAVSPEQMAVIAAFFGAIAVLGGLFGSLEWDTPSGPSIVVAAFVLFVLSLLPVQAIWRKKDLS